MSNHFVTSLTRYVIILTAFCLLVPAGSLAATLKIGGTGAALGTMRILADEFVATRPDISIEIPDSLGSGGGIKAVLAGALDIALSSRQLRPKEQNAGAYPISKSLYLVTDPKVSQAALDFIRFVQSNEGASILQTTGNLAIPSEG